MMAQGDTGGARSENSDSPRLAALLILLTVWLAIQLGGEPLRDALRYERTAVAAGQWWRPLTAHFVHLDFRHLAFNAAGLVLLWLLFIRLHSWRTWLLISGGAMLAVDAGLWLQQPAVQWYVGASGALHGLWSAGGWERWRRDGMAGSVALLALTLKLLLEHGRGASLVVGEMPVVLPAHLYGAIGGLLPPVIAQLIAHLRGTGRPRSL